MRFSLTGNIAGERPLSSVPVIVRITLVTSLALQLILHGISSGPQTRIEALPEPLSYDFLNIISMGEKTSLSRLLMLWIQGYDHQPGISVPFAQLDYENLTGWLDRIVWLDPGSHYALLSAARIYSEVPDQDRKRKILEFVYQQFLQQPDTRWPWLAHSVYVAKHRLQDKELALKYARELRLRTTPESTPEWARQMELFVHENFGDVQSAQILLGGLIDSGEITDEREIEFLLSRLGLPPGE